MESALNINLKSIINKMGHSSCCVINCKNTDIGSKCISDRFPTANHKLDQRKKCITAVKRKK